MKPNAVGLAVVAVFAVALFVATNVAAATPPTARWLTAFGRTFQAWERDAAPEQLPYHNLSGRTFRYVATLSAPGEKIRVRLSNELEREDVIIGNASIAVVGAEGNLKPLTWGGKKRGWATAGAPLLSDPVDLKVEPLQRVIISLYFPEAYNPGHRDNATSRDGYWKVMSSGRELAKSNAFYTIKGDFADKLDAPGAASEINTIVAGVEVLTSDPAWRSVIVLGTSGAASLDAWPAQLVKRAAAQKIAIANISQRAGGLYRAPIGQNELARLDREVIARPNVHAVILQTGVEDVAWGGLAKQYDLIGGSITPEPIADLSLMTSGYRQVVARAHAHGIKVIAATLEPFKGAAFDNAKRSERRAEVNKWIAAGGAFDGVIDVAATLADPSDQTKLLTKYDSGGHVGLTPEGHQAFADSIDLNLLK